MVLGVNLLSAWIVSMLSALMANFVLANVAMDLNTTVKIAPFVMKVSAYWVTAPELMTLFVCPVHQVVPSPSPTVQVGAILTARVTLSVHRAITQNVQPEPTAQEFAGRRL